MQQGRLLAAALSERGEPEAEESLRLLRQLEQRTESRLRVLDRGGRVLADTSLLGPRREAGGPAGAPAELARRNPLYLLGALPFYLYGLFEKPPVPAAEPAEYFSTTDRVSGPEVEAALAGRYGAATRLSPAGERAVILYSALPVRSGGEVVGAVLVSQSTRRILSQLYEVRLSVFSVFLGAVAAAIVLSLVIATTIARPLRGLAAEARALVDRRGRLRGRFRGSRRGDEIGDLARALEELTRRLANHLDFTEAFAADVSHEFKNPLASIRSATELLAEARSPEERARFLAMVERDVARMGRLLTGVREISRLDLELEAEQRLTVSVDLLLDQVVEGFRARAASGVEIDLALPGHPVLVAAVPERLVQVLENLLDNAVSFSPSGDRVTLELREEGGRAVIAVEDEGPGIPPQHLERIFDRFFSYRPDSQCRPDRPGQAETGEHAGLGLSIARAIVEGYGGTLTAANRPTGGARFEVRLPELSQARDPSDTGKTVHTPREQGREGPPRA